MEGRAPFKHSGKYFNISFKYENCILEYITMNVWISPSHKIERGGGINFKFEIPLQVAHALSNIIRASSTLTFQSISIGDEADQDDTASQSVRQSLNLMNCTV